MTPADNDPLLVAATGAFEHVLHDLGPLLARAGCAIRPSIANAAGVTRMIEDGIPADLVLTSEAALRGLAAKGLVVPGSETEIGRMRAGVGVGERIALPDLSTAEAVKASLLAAPRVATIDPVAGGTSGPLLDALYERLGIADAVRSKAVLGRTGRDIVRTLAAGEADLGLTQASELIGAPGIRFAGYLPKEIEIVSIYMAGVTTSSRRRDEAAAALDILRGSEARERLRAAGWEVEA